MKKINERGSLELLHEPDDGTFLVRLIENPQVAGSLEAARNWFMLGDYRLNGSQAQTVKNWASEYL